MSCGKTVGICATSACCFTFRRGNSHCHDCYHVSVKIEAIYIKKHVVICCHREYMYMCSGKVWWKRIATVGTVVFRKRKKWSADTMDSYISTRFSINLLDSFWVNAFYGQMNEWWKAHGCHALALLTQSTCQAELRKLFDESIMHLVPQAGCPVTVSSNSVQV